MLRRLTPFSILVLALLAIGCPGQKPPQSANAPAKPTEGEGPLVWKLSKSGLGFRLSNADDGADHPPEHNVSPSTPLSSVDAKKIAGSLPELKRDPDDEKEFSLRAKSLPAPRPGKTVNEPFPPPNGGPPPATVATGPLKVERHAPEGKVELAPNLAVSFSLPMVPLTTVDDLAKEHPPIKLTPEPPGKWRWLGTRTAMFQPDKRFPMATDYTVEVPAGTKAQNGQTLGQAERWTFTTPSPQMKTGLPQSGSQPLDPLVFVEFDQAIEARAMLDSIELTSGSGKTPIRLADADEVEANDQVRHVAQQAEKNRWLAFRPVNRLPTATSFTVRIKAGARGAEGPRATEKDQTFGFSTYGQLRVTNHSCASWGRRGQETCPPLSPLAISFTNALDPKAFDPKLVTISPELAGMKVEAHGNSLSIRGKTKGRTKYTVTVGGGLTDTYGQTLGANTPVEFTIGSTEPTMFGAEQDMLVLDPAQKAKTYPVYTINEPGLHTRVYAVTPDDWRKFVLFAQEWERPRKLSPPGKLIYDKTINPKKAPDELVTTPIDLVPALSGGFGQVLVVIEPTHTLPKGWSRPELHVWVQSTELGLDALIEQDQVFGWTTRLADGAPIEGVDVQLLGAGSGKSDVSGLAKVALSSTPGRLLVGKKGKDTVIVPERWFGEPSYHAMTMTDQLRWFVYDDRGMYKPSEEVRLKGFLRRSGTNRGGDISEIPEVNGKKISFKVRDARWAELTTGSATLDEHGGFDLAFKLPNNANLGAAHVELDAGGMPFDNSSYQHRFEIEEFRRPEFEVTAQVNDGPKFVGRHAIATLSAAYYSGGGLPDAPVDWRVTRSTVGFIPPNRSDYHFGPEPRSFWSRTSSKDEPKTETWTAKTNPQGIHRLRVDFDALEPPYPMSLQMVANVTDVNRQSWAGQTQMIVHPSDDYVGVKLAKNFIRAGENIDADVIVVDIEGKAIAGHASLKAARIDQVQKGTEYEERELETQTCEIDGAGKCTFKTKEGGSWRVTAVVADSHGRKNQTASSLWVMGGERPKSRSLEGSRANLVLDKKEYQPNDLADVLIVSPFAPAEGILTVQRQGIVHLERFSMKTTSQTIKVKLDEALVPNAEIRVDLVGQDTRTDDAGNPDERLPKRPAFAAGSATASVLPTTRKLDVKATSARPTLEPGGTTNIDVEVKDNVGHSVKDAEVSLVVVDEAVLALSGYKTPDPIAAFYGPRPSGVQELGMRDRVLLGEPDLTKLRAAEGREDDAAPAKAGRSYRLAAGGAMPPPPPGAPMPTTVAAPKPQAEVADKKVALDEVSKNKAGKDDRAKEEGSVVGDSKKPMQVRSDFSALALFSPAVKTNAQGKATVPLKLPDNLTRYRVMAVAATTTKHFGAGESTITAQLPLMVRPSAPRFLNFGDRFELPVVVQNQTDKEIEVGVVARATNAVVEEPSAKKVKIAARDRVEVRFLSSTVKPGTARFQIGIASGSFADASQVELPVYTPATTEAFATYGEIDEGAMAQPVKMPPNVFSQFGGLEITTSSTQLQALTDAFVYLVRYPFECNEQLASRVVSIAALRDVLSAFKAKDLPSPAALNASMQSDFEKLKRRQHYSGGWGFWQEEPWPYLSVHVAHALVRAKEKGYKPDDVMLQRAQSYLRSIESHIPSWYGEEARRAIIAYSIYVRNRMKDPDATKAKRLLTEAADKLGIEALGWIWPTISEDKASATENEAIRRHVANRVTETAGAAHFVSGYKDANWVLLHSDRRADGVLLEAMIGDQKESTLIPKIVKGLLAHKKAGRWYNTQENAFVLLALDRYFNTYEKTTPDFVARVWLGEKYAGDHTFKGRTTEYANIGIPMNLLAAETKSGPQNLVIGKDGPGRLYYRVGMQYAPTDLKLPPADYGFVVSRLYEGADKPDDVKRDPDGTWRVKAGAKVRVRLSMVATSRRYHVALVDPIPAGLEPMNPALAVTGEIPKDPKSEPKDRYWYWQRTWYEHQNMRDERVEAFASLLYDGVWDYTYVARATTPGTFVVPPTKAEEMYSPETFGRSGGDRMIVE